jgi:hypothetical protein
MELAAEGPNHQRQACQLNAEPRSWLHNARETSRRVAAGAEISVDHERSFDLDPFFLSVPVAVESCVVWVNATAVAVDELHPGLVTASVLSADDLGLGRGCGNDNAKYD